MAPPMTTSAGLFETGRDSPVSIASLKEDSPSVITPSTGILAPGRISTRSPGCKELTGTSCILPCASSFSAVSGNSRTSSSKARRSHDRTHLEPMAEQHDVDEGHQLPVKGHALKAESHRR